MGEVVAVKGLDIELRGAWRRTWAKRRMPALVLVAVLLVPAAWLSVPVPSGAIHAELARLRSANELIGLALTVAAVLSTYWLWTPDVEDGFESLSPRGGSRLLTFAAGRVLVGAGGILVTALALTILVEALDARGRYQGDEAVRVAALFANSMSLFMLAMALTCAFGRIIGLIAAFFLQSVGGDAAYQRGAMSDGFITANAFVSAEQLIGWLAPRPLVDRLAGIAVVDQSVALHQFPVREGHAVWGTDLIQVSGPADIVQYFVYLLVMAAVLYLACWRRARQARVRAHPMARWLGTWMARRDADESEATSSKP